MISEEQRACREGFCGSLPWGWLDPWAPEGRGVRLRPPAALSGVVTPGSKSHSLLSTDSARSQSMCGSAPERKRRHYTQKAKGRHRGQQSRRLTTADISVMGEKQPTSRHADPDTSSISDKRSITG